MNKKSKSDGGMILQRHLVKMKEIVQSSSFAESDIEKRIIKDYLFKIYEQIEESNSDESSSFLAMADDSYEKVSLYIDLALNTFQKISHPSLDTVQRTKFIFFLSETYEALGNYTAALFNYEKARDLAATQQNRILEGKTQYCMGRIYSEMGRWEKANELLHTAIDTFQTVSDFNGITLARLVLAKIAYRKGQYSIAQQLFEIALESGELINDISNMATIGNHLGIILRMQGKYEAAYQYFQKALINFQSVQDKQGTAESLNNLGVVHLKRDNYREAIGYFEKALQMCKAIGYMPLMSFVFLNKAEFYTAVGDYPMAATVCGKAMEILVRLKNPVGIAKANRLLGQLFWKSGDVKFAQSFFQESIQLYQEFWIPLGLANTYREFAIMLKEIGRVDEAATISERADHMMEQLMVEENGKGFVAQNSDMLNMDNVGKESNSTSTGEKSDIRI